MFPRKIWKIQNFKLLCTIIYSKRSVKSISSFENKQHHNDCILKIKYLLYFDVYGNITIDDKYILIIYLTLSFWNPPAFRGFMTKTKATAFGRKSRSTFSHFSSSPNPGVSTIIVFP